MKFFNMNVWGYTEIMNRKSPKYLAYLGVITAVMIIMEITGIGYIKFGVGFIVSISIMSVPVVIAACTLGKWAGVYTGAIFGMTSLAQAFGRDPIGAVLIQSHPAQMIVTCVIMRIAVGFVSESCYDLFTRKLNMKDYGIWVTALVTPVANTVLYSLCFSIMFWNVPQIQGVMGLFPNVYAFLAAFLAMVGFNAIVEALASVLIAVPISKVIRRELQKAEVKL